MNMHKIDHTYHFDFQYPNDVWVKRGLKLKIETVEKNLFPCGPVLLNCALIRDGKTVVIDIPKEERFFFYRSATVDFAKRLCESLLIRCITDGYLKIQKFKERKYDPKKYKQVIA